MSFDLVKLTVTARRHVPTSFGNKDAFYSESLEIPSDSLVDRSSVYAFLTQRLDLTYLLDYYYSTPSQSGESPNPEIWPFIVARIKSMEAMYANFPIDVKNILAFIPEMYLGSKS